MLLFGKIYLSVFILTLYSSNPLFAQDTISNFDVIDSVRNQVVKNHNDYSLNYKQLIVPGVLIAYGSIAVKNKSFQQFNRWVKEEVDKSSAKGTVLDDYTQYFPAFMVYGLNAVGVKGKHNYRDLTIIYATSQLLSAAFVVPIKRIVDEKRPNGVSSHSFPSGHTATAFSSAHFMYREYRDTNFWLSISGYPFAVFTGTYRVINNRHWVGDVVAGAGFGILSTELAYWLYPTLSKIIPGHKGNTSTMLMPFYQNSTYGLSLVRNF